MKGLWVNKDKSVVVDMVDYDNAVRITLNSGKVRYYVLLNPEDTLADIMSKFSQLSVSIDIGDPEL